MATNATTSHGAHRGTDAVVLAGCAADTDAGHSFPTSPALATTLSSEPHA